jgi:hypothetical protein
MRTFVVMSSDLARCPKRSLLAAHWREDGTCECEHARANKRRLAALERSIARVRGQLDALVAERDRLRGRM